MRRADRLLPSLLQGQNQLDLAHRPVELLSDLERRGTVIGELEHITVPLVVWGHRIVALLLIRLFLVQRDLELRSSVGFVGEAGELLDPFVGVVDDGLEAGQLGVDAAVDLTG